MKYRISFGEKRNKIERGELVISSMQNGLSAHVELGFYWAKLKKFKLKIDSNLVL